MTASGIFIHPSTWFVLAALLLPFAKRIGLHKPLLVAVPLITFLLIQQLPETFGVVNYLGFDIIFGKVDRLTFVFLHVFTLMSILGCVYSLHVKETGQHVAALLYIAGSLGVTLAGDYLTIFVFWELMAFASTFLIWFRRSERSQAAGYRYLLVHIAGGLTLFAGIFLRYQNIHDLHFTRIALENASLAEYLIMAGFALNAAVPPLHAWLADGYPEATATGAVFMCAFTTKTAVYVLARAFPGSMVLMIAGAIMTLYGVCYATIENDSRRILSYHIISQVGYMVCGIGIGTPLAINGVCAHAYAHIIYKALLLMGAGSVLEMTGRSKLSDLGGLYRYMPATMLFTIIGGISISGFPLTSGFVSKSMIVAAAGEHHQVIIMLMLLAASVGTFLSVGIKLPYFIWYGGKESEFKATESPWNMQLAMAIAAFLCIFIGCYPQYLYRMLPYPVAYHPYTGYHISETLQIFAFTGLGFYLLVEKLRPAPCINLDLDWFYRKGTLVFIWLCKHPLNTANEIISNLYKNIGLAFTLGTARFLSWFDRVAIDGFLDGSARGVLRMGDEVRLLVTGRLQQYIGGALALMFIIVAIVLWVVARFP